MRLTRTAVLYSIMTVSLAACTPIQQRGLPPETPTTTVAAKAPSCPANASWAPAPPNSADSLSDYQKSVDTRNRNDCA